MTNVLDVPASPLIEVLAKELASNAAFAPPEWAPHVKTGRHREKAPHRDDWWHVRVASVLRKVALNAPIGAARLSQLYGGSADRGSKPDRATSGSEHIARTALQQLERAGFVARGPKGRMIASAGAKALSAATRKVQLELVATIPALEKY